MSDPSLQVTPLHILVDERDKRYFTKFNGSWSIQSPLLTYMEKSGFYEGHAMWTSDSSAWFAFEFNGTSFSFVGNVGPSQHPNPNIQRVADIQIDGGRPTRIEYPCCGYTTWYRSPSLPDGLHKVLVSAIGPAEVDFATIRAGKSSKILEQVIFMDNEDPAIRYSGNWTRRTKEIKDRQLTNTEAGFPVNGSTHQTSTVGDSFAFGFAGTRVAVYGIFDWLSTGMFSLSFSIDGESPDVQTYRSRKFAIQDSNQVMSGEVLNYVLYSQMELQEGPHTMVVTLTRCESQVFSFDYLTYQASFESFGSRAIVTAPALSPSSLGPSSPNSTGRTNQGLNIGLISGLSIGGLALVCASVLLSIWLRQRNQSHQQDQKSGSPSLSEEEIVPFPNEPKAERGQSIRVDNPGYVAEGLSGTSTAARNPHSTSTTVTSRRADVALPYSTFLDVPTHLGTAAALKQERADAAVINRRRLDELSPGNSGHRNTGVSELIDPARSGSSGSRPISAVAPAALPDAAMRVETATATSPEGPPLTLHPTEPPPAYEGVQISQA